MVVEGTIEYVYILTRYQFLDPCRKKIIDGEMGLPFSLLTGTIATTIILGTSRALYNSDKVSATLNRNHN